MQKTILKIAVRLVLLALILVGMNWIYVRFFFEADIQEHAEVIDEVREVPLNADIVYLGESSNISNRPDDMDKRPISAMIGDHFPSLNTADITKPAAHAGIYKTLLSHIPDDSQISTVIVTLNLRSFNAQWIYSDLETSLQKSMVLLLPYPPLFNRFLLSFKAYDIKTDEERTRQFLQKWEKDEFQFPYAFPHNNVREWDTWMASNGIRDDNGWIDYQKTELACHFIKAYGFQIDTLHNPRINDFDDIIQLARKRNWNLVFNLMAENVEKAEELVGDDLLFLMDQNRDLLKSYFGRKGVLVVDNMEAVPDQEFIDRDWTTEHYAERGRKIVAANVARAISTYYPNDYTTVELKYEYETRFFNDCDSGDIWGADYSRSTEQAFSGNHSSKTGQGMEYSTTLAYPFRRIPDSLKRAVTIRAMIYQESANHDARMVIQAHGDFIKDYWEGFELGIPEDKSNRWIPFEITTRIPKEIYNANIIKIYLYNPTQTLIYLDDLEITFSDGSSL